MNVFLKTTSLLCIISPLLYGGGEMQDNRWNEEWPSYKNKLADIFTSSIEDSKKAVSQSNGIHGQTIAHKGTIDLLTKFLGG